MNQFFSEKVTHVGSQEGGTSRQRFQRFRMVADSSFKPTVIYCEQV